MADDSPFTVDPRGIAATTTAIPVQYTHGKPLRRYILWYTIVSLAITAVWGGALAILIPNQVQGLMFGSFFTGADAGVDLTALTNLRSDVAAGTATATADQQRLLGLLGQFEGARASALALVTSIGTIGTMLMQPIIGVFSDRTRSKWGRRAPWILYGGLLGALLLVAVRFAPTVAVLVVLWTLAQVVLNASSTPLTATMADRVPEDRLGTVSAMGGLGNFIGGILGGVAAGALFATIGLDVYLIIAFGVALAVVLFVLFTRDRSSKDLELAKFRWGAFFKGFLVPLLDRDFRWVWIARVLLLFGYGVSTALGLYMLQSYIHPAMSQADASATAPLITLVGLPFTVIALLTAGRLSDRLGRRKPFVIAASILMAVSMMIPLISPTLPGLFIQAIVAGIAFGIFLPVDQALFVDVLPDIEADAGRDLGIAGMATNLGQSLSPILAAQIVVLTGGYQLVWVAGIVLVAIAAVAILPVKGAR
ncbi:MFS transporter [Microbacterium invictum]|uniref:MFS family permease n=1 Tax=Microbacterium invictum TaxID=515415 RepID=A0AA40SSB3_9MICO|nr:MULTISPECIES: MFS transporter [Microbacterium]MBB4141327.1 MFS family permease [Microbacterium invictum]